MFRGKIIFSKGIAVILSTFLAMTMLPSGLLRASAEVNEKTLLDISQGPISIGDGTVDGHDSKGNEVKTPNTNGYIITGTSTMSTITVSGGTQNITLNGVNIDAKSSNGCAFLIKSGATVNLTLSGTNNLKSYGNYAGLQVPKGAALTIDKSGSDNSADILTAACVSNDGSDSAAGIGNNYHYPAGDITINGGTVTAHGGDYCYGIGGNFSESGDIGGDIKINGGIVNADSESTDMPGGGIGGYCSGITITGGTVTATAVPAAAITDSSIMCYRAGIGGKMRAGSGDISISGGTVIATASVGAAIGGDNQYGGGSISISGGIVNASSKYGAGIGAGNNDSNCNVGTIKISGGTVNASSELGSGIGNSQSFACSSCAITISGGMINANGATCGIGAANSQNIINGGSVHVTNESGFGNVFPEATFDGSTKAYLETITLPDSADIVKLDITHDGNTVPYNYAGIKTDDNKKLYLYLPEYSGDTKVAVTVSGGQTYSGYHGKVDGSGSALKLDQSPLSFSESEIPCELGKSVTIQAAGGTCSGIVSYKKNRSGDTWYNLKDNGDGTATVTAINTGTATITATRSGNDIYYDATAQIMIDCSTSLTVSPISDQAFTGSEIKPEPSVTDKYSKTVLTKGTDYDLVYYDDKTKYVDNYDDYTSGGWHYFTIVGKGKYSGDNTDVQFNIISPVTITSISPSSGPEAGGTVVTIKGTHFANASEVDFGHKPAAKFTVADDSTITVTAPEGQGKVTVYVETPDGKSDYNTDSAIYTYVATTLSSIVLSAPSSGSSGIAVGDTEQLTAIGHYEDNYTKNISNRVSWSSSDTSVATVTDNGTVTAVSAGTAIITAALNGVSSTITIMVKKEYTINVLQSGGGSVAVTGAYKLSLGIGMGYIKVLDGSTVVLSAKPDSGNTFEGWYQKGVDGSYGICNPKTSDNPTLVLTPTDNDGYYINFTQIPSPSLITAVTGSGTVSVNDGTASGGATQSFTLGTSVKLTAAAGDGNQFLYWQDENGRMLSNTATYSFTLDSDTKVTAVFAAKAAATHLVTFVNGVTNDTIESIYVNTKASTVNCPSGPYLYGYKFTGWDKDNNAIQGTTGDVVVTAQFIKNAAICNLTVTNGTQSGSGTYSSKDFVTVTANTAATGKKFSCWEDENQNNNIISYSPTYSFYIITDAKLKAEYVDDTSAVIQNPSIVISNVSKNASAGQITFIAQRTVPDGCTVLSQGIILTNDGTLTADTFVIGKAKVLKAKGKTTGLTGTYVITKGNVSSGSIWYARGYVIYKDANGNIVTKYSSIVS